MNISLNPIQQVELIKKNYCIGCGACSLVSGVTIGFDTYGKYQLRFDGISENQCKQVLKICPFAFDQISEDDISHSLFQKIELKDLIIGYYINNFIGHVTDDTKRLNSSSGGIITWLLLRLLKEDRITNAVFVAETPSQKTLFEYQISSDKNAVLRGASSKYYPVELSYVLNQIKNRKGRYAIVALPCFAKSIRLLQNHYPVFKRRIKYIISPVCGHLKTKRYAEILALQQGIESNDLIGINFRKKLPSELASKYGTEFICKENDQILKKIVKTSSIKFATNWGHGMFKYPACDYCDDVFGETADISVGDAWVREYIQDYKGNSVVTTRNLTLDKVIDDGVKDNELYLEKVTAATIIKSQAGGIRNKREDLAYRQYLKKRAQQFYPRKRVKPSCSNISKRRKNIIKQRLKISQLSHEVFKKSLYFRDFNFFVSKLSPEIKKYKNLYTTPGKKLKKNIKMTLKKLGFLK